MKIKVAHSTGRPEPQFVVEAETDEDRLFLNQFLTAQNHSENTLTFTLHGHCFDMKGYTSFNFGWCENKKPKP